MKKTVDIIVLGATGFTGQCTVQQLARLTQEKYCDITWGIAGRSKEKLHKIITNSDETGLAFKNLTIIEVDIENEESLKKMLDVAKVVINCTGPNSVLSPPIVKACIETGTHYVDISAEMFHILNLYKNYHKAAEDANVLIIPSCGFVAIPAEAGMIYLDKQFKGTLNTVQCYVELLMQSAVPKVFLLHNGTWTSLVSVLETFKQHIALKKELFPKPIELVPEEMNKSLFHRHKGRTWFPYPATENDSVDMSQRYLYEKTKKKPVHFKAYTSVQYSFQLIGVLFGILVLYLYHYLSYFSCFRKLLINHPRLMTLGSVSVSEKGPTEQMRKDTKFRFVLNGRGWDIGQDTKSEPTKKITVKVSGQDPGYDSTAIAVIMCAITILKEKSQMPNGGVIMPGAAFYRTDIVDRLTSDCYLFEVVQNE
ncbi:saccharopine dehydrogenase-like oxidoreductase [Anticarsia gemmatalis]|uniref:saccharopine dehydrogenase-like oxidoreductase n=1 Tax=Anticarsia gemmatalis TaxID=129554 RepID=UPI003F76C498